MFNRKLFFTVAMAIVFLAPRAFADFSISELVDVTKLALNDFQLNQKEHVPHFVGYKSWKSGEDSKVKIYVTHDGMNMEFNYLCHKHDASMECHAQ